MTEPKLLTTRELARVLGVAQITIQRLAARRDLPGRKVAGRWRFDLAEVEEALQRQAAQPGADRTPLIEALDSIRRELRRIRKDIRKLSVRERR